MMIPSMPFFFRCHGTRLLTASGSFVVVGSSSTASLAVPGLDPSAGSFCSGTVPMVWDGLVGDVNPLKAATRKDMTKISLGLWTEWEGLVWGGG